MDPTTPIMLPTVAHNTAPDSEPSQFILPDLINDCHYPLRKNPHCYAVSCASDQWLIDVARLAEHELRGYIEMDAGRFAAFLYPDADAFHLQVCCDFINWIFIIDDWMEGRCRRSTGSTRILYFLRYAIPSILILEQLGAKMCKSFFSRFRETASLGCTEWFIHGSELFFAGAAKQAGDLCQGTDSGIKPCFALIEFVAGIDLPDEVMSHPVVKALEDATNDHVACNDDILSYNKEQSRGDEHWENIVAVLMHDRGLDLHSAMDHAGQMCKDAIQHFEFNCTILPSWGEDVDRQVAIYIEGLQNWMIGSLHWHFVSARYFGKDRHAVKLDRIVKLLPKKHL
ncbi:isoprenoid synthase domain-containing protein [Suillus subaureus]|uniref:Terpene synthase n=1 Tax=Suillus subaureus TaxID=48587 RepID=A0A9P7JGF5_9AGAM|nr:isoprenoid synthase domain-containing protein [Suillus subaureus]KAG1820887.1 isoprenoid synthase domain-containing protein [Suillus subaureus]